MKQIQLKIQVQLHKINLNVRFPCRVLVYLKLQTEEVLVGRDVELKNNEAVFDQKTQHLLKTFYDEAKQQFTHKKIALIIYLKSTNGKIPAGNSLIDLNSLRKGENQLQLNIEKCPDKNALLFININYVIKSQFEIYSNEQNIVNPKIKQINNYEIKSQRNDMQHLYQSTYTRTNPQKMKSEDKNLYNEQAQSQYENESIQQERLNSVKDRRINRNNQFRSSIISNKKSDVRSTQQANQRIKDLERQLQGNKNVITNIQSQNHLKKSRMNELEKEIKILQKKSEQKTIQLKNLTLKSDILEKTLKQTEVQYKIIQQKYEDLSNSHDNFMKRMKEKQSNFLEQIKQLTQKLQTSEKENQKMIFQKNDLLLNFEDRQKALRGSFRQKEKSTLDEKGKQLKKIQDLNKTINDLTANQQEHEKKFIDISEQLMEKVKQLSKLEQTKDDLLHENEELKAKFRLQIVNRDVIEQLRRQTQELQQEKKKNKKNFQQKDQQLSKQQKTIVNLQANNSKLQKRIEQLQIQLKQKTVNHKNSLKEVQGVTKQYEELKKANLQVEKQLKDMVLLKENQITKNLNLKDQIKAIEKKYQQQIKNLKKQVKDRDVALYSLKEQLAQNSEQVNSYNQRLIEYERQNNVLRINFERKVEQYEIIQNQKDDLLSSNVQLEARILQLQDEIDQIQSEKKKENGESQKKNRQLQKTLKGLREENEINEEKWRVEKIELQKQVSLLSSNVKDNEKQIGLLNDRISDLKSSEMKSNSMYEQSQYEITLKNNEILFLKDSLNKSGSDVSNYINELKELNIKMLQKEKQLIENSQMIQSLTNQINLTKNQEQRVSYQLTNYVSMNKNSIKHFCLLINKNEEIDEKEIEHEDQQIIKQLRNSVIVRNSYLKSIAEQFSIQQSERNSLQQNISHLEQKISNLNAVLNETRTQLSNTKNQLEQSEKNSSNNLGKTKQELSQLIKQKALIEKNLEKQIQRKQSLIKQNQNLKKEGVQTNNSNKLKFEQQQKQWKQKLDEASSLAAKREQQNKNYAASLNKKINELERSLQKEINNSTGSSSKLAEAKQQFKDYQEKADKNLQEKLSQIDRLTKAAHSQKNQIQLKANVIAKYLEIEKQLRENIRNMTEEIKNLKNLSSNSSKSNEKLMQREKELQQTVSLLKKSEMSLKQKNSELQATIKTKNTEIATGKQNLIRMQKEKEKLQVQLQSKNKLIKLKEQQILRIDSNLKKLQGELNEQKSENKKYKQQDLQSKKQIKEMTTNKQILEKQLNDIKKKLTQMQDQYSKESKANSSNNQKLSLQNKNQANELKEAKIKIKQLEDKVNSLTKFLDNMEKTHNMENNYLKPVKQNLHLIRCHMSEYSKMSDEFQSNKNKLNKLSSTRIEPYSDKSFGDKIRDVNTVWQKMKNQILTKADLSQSQKEIFMEQSKKLQLTMEKVLKADR